MRRTAWAIVIALAVIASACGGGDDDAESTGADASQEATGGSEAGDGAESAPSPGDGITVPDSAGLATITATMPGDIDGVAVGLGSVWAHVFPADGDPELVRVDPATGEIVGRAVVPELGPAVLVGDDAIWVVGNFRIHRIDPASMTVESSEFTPPDAFLVSWFHAGGSIWGVAADTGDVYRLEGTGAIELAVSVDAEENSSAVVGTTLFIEDARTDDAGSDVMRSVVVVDLETLTERGRLDVAATGLGGDGTAAWGSTAPFDDDHPSLFRIDEATLEVTRLEVEVSGALFEEAVGGPGGAVFQKMAADGTNMVLRISGSTVERADFASLPFPVASDGIQLWGATFDDPTTLVGVG